MFKNTTLLKYSERYAHFSYIKVNLILCTIFNFISTCLGTSYGSGESLLLRSTFQQLAILVDVLIKYKLLSTLFFLIHCLILSIQIYAYHS